MKNSEVRAVHKMKHTPIEECTHHDKFQFSIDLDYDMITGDVSVFDQIESPDSST